MLVLANAPMNKDLDNSFKHHMVKGYLLEQAFNGRTNPVEDSFIGSNWEFTFNHLNREQQRILQFGLDCEFREINNINFEFMNMVKGYKKWDSQCLVRNGKTSSFAMMLSLILDEI